MESTCFRDQLNNRVDTGAHLKRTHATFASLINPFPLIEVVAFLSGVLGAFWDVSNDPNFLNQNGLYGIRKKKRVNRPKKKNKVFLEEEGRQVAIEPLL